MVSLSLKSERLFDPVRKKWVEKTPEECIRQCLIQRMIHKLGYPSALLAVEKELSKLPHLSLNSKKDLPKRRADIIFFAKGKVSLFPLLMIECKAVPLTPKFARQVIGYNAFVRAPYLAIANEKEVLTGSYDDEAGMFRFQKGLPTFFELMSKI